MLRASFASILVLLAVLAILAGCGPSDPERQRAIGEAFAGPMTLTLRKELTPKAPAVATLKHGDRVEVLETRRRFTKVRTVQGIEGWTDGALLMNPEQMEGLKRLAAQAAKMPSQGRASVYDALNAHSEPARQSPSIFQISEGAWVEVLAHRLVPRAAAPPAVRTEPVKKEAPKRKKKKSPSIPPPPIPAPPPPPPDWQALSRPRASDLPETAAEAQASPARPVPMDDWNLVRAADGRAGWVLARNLMLGVPDDIAQYAEGHRIVGYLQLGEVKDKDTGKSHGNYLWTTIARGMEPYVFDSFRVFVWSTRRHRYETAYIERNVQGYFPIEFAGTSESPGFSLILTAKDGSLVRRTYAFSGYRVRMVKQEAYQKPVEQPAAAPLTTANPPSSPGLTDRMKGMWRRVFGQ